MKKKFQNRDSKRIFNESENFSLKSNAVFGNLSCMVFKFDRQKDLLKTWRMRRTKIFKLAPIRKRFRYSESASLSDQKSLPQHFPNPQGYEIQ